MSRTLNKLISPNLSHCTDLSIFNLSELEHFITPKTFLFEFIKFSFSLFGLVIKK
jgi:hypothetical protein